jgi:hypothetical protein
MVDTDFCIYFCFDCFFCFVWPESEGPTSDDCYDKDTTIPRLTT